MLGNRNICIARELTKIHEEYIRGTVKEVIEHFEEVLPKGEMVLIIEGKTEVEIEQEKEKSLEDVTIEELLNEYLNKGLTRKEAVKKAAKDKKMDKNQVYKICISLKK